MIFARLLVILLFCTGFAVNARATERGVTAKMQQYLDANIHNYIAGLTSAELMDCLAIEQLNEIFIEDNKFVPRAERVKKRERSEFVQGVWGKALVQSGVATPEQEAAILPNTQLKKIMPANATLEVFKTGKAFKNKREADAFSDIADVYDAKCVKSYNTALNSIIDFVNANREIVLAPPADNPYEYDVGNESLTGLFRSLDEYLPANERVTAQRCYMVTLLPNVYLGGELLIPSSVQFGYGNYEDMTTDMILIQDHFGPILDKMPANAQTHWAAREEPKNEMGALLKTGTKVQSGMLIAAAKRAIPDCVSRAKKGA